MRRVTGDPRRRHSIRSSCLVAPFIADAGFASIIALESAEGKTLLDLDERTLTATTV
jgi:hypothetical protein